MNVRSDHEGRVAVLACNPLTLLLGASVCTGAFSDYSAFWWKPGTADVFLASNSLRAIVTLLGNFELNETAGTVDARCLPFGWFMRPTNGPTTC